jgi:hypothetical protein
LLCCVFAQLLFPCQSPSPFISTKIPHNPSPAKIHLAAAKPLTNAGPVAAATPPNNAMHGLRKTVLHPQPTPKKLIPNKRHQYPTPPIEALKKISCYRIQHGPPRKSHAAIKERHQPLTARNANRPTKMIVVKQTLVARNPK